jgi:BarA-like signal transduction histidine kinase
MQLLSRVKPNCATDWGSSDVMIRRPKVAVKIAQYIAEWTETETLMGIFLALLLHAHEDAVIAIYSGVENRASQLKIIKSATQSMLPQDHFDVISVFMTTDIKPAMTYRDKLAHWCWGLSDELPDALLMRQPSDKLANLLGAVRQQSEGRRLVEIPIKYDTIYVLTEPDLDRALSNLAKTHGLLLIAIGSVWQINAPELRASLLRQLADKPQIRSGLDRLAANRKKTPEAQQSSPPSEPNDES